MTPNAGRSQLPILLVLLGLFGLGTVAAFVNGFSLAPGGAFSWDAFGVLVAAGLTLALYSFLYEDNPFFKAAEHLYVGIGLGYQIGIAWFEYIKPEAYKQLIKFAVRPDVPGRPEWALIPALVLSALLLARFEIIRPALQFIVDISGMCHKLIVAIRETR